MVLNEQERTLRQYLLGNLSEADEETVELWLMSEDEAYDLLSAAEDDLIDELISGKLSPRDLEHFNNHFLVAPERKRKLQFSQAFRRYVDEKNVVSRWAAKPAFTLGDLFRYRPVFAYASCALIVLLMGSGLWLGFQFREVQQQLDAARVQFAAERNELKQQLDESQALGERLQSNLRDLEQVVTSVKSPPWPGSLVAVVLMPNSLRAPTQVQTVDLTTKAQVAELSLTLIDDNYESYQAVLMDDEGKELWAQDRLSPKPAGENKAIRFIVPASRLAPGEFNIRLSGRSAADPPEKIDTYLFRATR
jgi:hypothetical protein